MSVALLLLIVGAFCQDNPFVVSGVVTDSEKREPLLYANVNLLGSNLSTTTDSAGKFTLRVPNGNGTLRIRFMGFETQEIGIRGRSIINVSLSPSTNSLDGVVVIGYGTVTKRDLTGAVGKVEMADMEKAPVASFEQALAGRLAGVRVAATDGQPGEGPNIVIRGNNSLTQSNSPLYVIDGFPMENFNSNSINMAEIESIEVLKDASSTAVYGARGANGVIMLTTKKGKAGATQVNYNGFSGFANANNSRLDVLEPYDFIALQLEIDRPRATNFYFVDDDPATPDLTLEDYRNVKGINWYDKVVSPAAFFQNHTLRVSGGSEKTKFSLSASYLDQDGVVMRSGFDRMQGRFTLDHNINKKFKVGVNVNYSDAKVSGIKPRDQTGMAAGSGNSQVQNLFYNLWTFRPIGNPDYDVDFEDVEVDPEAETYLYNPIKTVQNQHDVEKNKHITFNGYLEYDIAKGLKLRVTGGADLSRTISELFNNSSTRSGSPSTTIGRSNGVNGSLSQNEIVNLSNENILTYNKKFNNNHRLTAVGAFSVQTRKSSGFGYKANQLPNEALGLSGLEEGIVYGSSSTSTNWGLLSYTGRVNYNLFEKYIFTATIRADGSSKFAEGNKFGYFPSGAFAWRLGDEKFMEGLPFISNAKLRASYGVTGNNRISDFAYFARIASAGYYPFGSSVTPAFTQSVFENSTLKWETTGQFDAGLELGLFRNRLSAELDYYHKNTFDLLYNSRLPTSTGYSSATVNFGKIQNRGFELTFNSQNIETKNFTWNSNLNISFNQNKLVALTMDEDRLFTTIPSFGTIFSSPAWISRVGDQLVHFYGFVFDGVYQYSDFNKQGELKRELPTTAGLLGTQARQPGDAKYKDLNNDGIVNDADQTIIGNPYPKHIGGFSNNFTYKNFDLNIFLQWSYGNEVLNANKINMENMNGGTLNRNVSVSFLDRWTPENQNTSIPRSGSNGITAVLSTRYIEDASFLRLKTVSLGYNIKRDLIRGLKAARISLSAQNLYTWTKYSGPDPEVSTKGFGLTPAFDFSAYPQVQTIVFGLNVTL